MILENSLFSLDVPAKGAADGHVKMILKDETPQSIGLIGVMSNVVSSLLFERLQAQGSNIIIKYGKGEVDILARRENDGLDLTWGPKQIDPGEMKRIQTKISDKMFVAPSEEPKVPDPEKEVAQEDGDDDYLVKQLNRIP